MNLYGLAQVTREMGLGGARKLKHEGSLEDVRANDLVLRCSQKVGEAKHNTCRSANAFRAIHSIKSQFCCRDALSAIKPKQFFQLQMRWKPSCCELLAITHSKSGLLEQLTGSWPSNTHIDKPRLKTVKRFQKHPAISCSFLFPEPYERFDDFCKNMEDPDSSRQTHQNSPGFQQ